MRHLVALFTLCTLLPTGRAASAQTTVFADEFNGSSLSSSWSVYGTDRFLQRTQFGGTPIIGAEGTTKFLRLRLNTFNPQSQYAGTYLRGTEMLTKQLFTSGSGLEIEARLRAPNLPRGVVWAFFTIGERGSWPTTYMRDEIDFENISNLGTNVLWLNVFDDWKTTDPVSPNESNATIAGLNWANWTTYKIRWLPNRVEWYVNNGAGDVLVRTETAVLPNDGQSIRFNIWAPSSDWPLAYDANLRATNNSSQNITYYCDIDYVRVKSLAPGGIVGTGDGLKAEYFDNADRTNLKTTRVDPQVNFNWGSGAPASGMGSDTFSVRWTGQVQAQYSQTYTFFTKTDDGVRLWVNGQQLINQWKNQGPTEYSATLGLVGGQKYDIRMEYFDNSSGASAQLSWSSASTPKQTIPKSQLYSAGVTPPPPTDTAAPVATITSPTNTYSYRTLAQAAGTASDTGGSNLQSVRVRFSRAGDGFFWNGSAWVSGETDVAANGTSSWTFALPTGLPNGKYSLRAIARDGAGNVGQSALTEFYIDSTAPIATITSPTHTWSYRTVTQATGTASDAVGVASVKGRLQRRSDNLYWNGASWVTSASEYSASGATNWTLALPALTDGRYSLRASAQDWVGNVGTSNTIDFYIDSVAPQVTISQPQAGATYDSSFTQARGTASDAVGVAEVRCVLQRNANGQFWNGSAWTSNWTENLATGTTSWTYNLPPLPAGQYTFWAIATDWVGNRTMTASRSFRVQ